METFSKRIESAVERLKAWLHERSRAYQTAFLNPVGEIVLADLAKFCRAHASTFHKDPYMQARLDGRREVWLRIQHQLKLTPDQLWMLYGRPDLEK